MLTDIKICSRIRGPKYNRISEYEYLFKRHSEADLHEPVVVGVQGTSREVVVHLDDWYVLLVRHQNPVFTADERRQVHAAAVTVVRWTQINDFLKEFFTKCK